MTDVDIMESAVKLRVYFKFTSRMKVNHVSYLVWQSTASSFLFVTDITVLGVKT